MIFFLALNSDTAPIFELPALFMLVMGVEYNLRESSANLASRFTKCVKHELNQWQLCIVFVISSERL